MKYISICKTVICLAFCCFTNIVFSQTLHLRANAASTLWLQKSGVFTSESSSVPVEKWLDLRQKQIQYAENNGYPFASIRLDSLSGDSTDLYAKVIFTEGNYIVFDTMTIVGNLNIHTKFLAAWLQIGKGKPFSQQRINELPNRIAQLPYIRLNGSPEIIFHNNRAFVRLLLDTKPANQADGLIGFLPNEEKTGSLTLTGQLSLKLHNLFKRGKTLNLDWQRIRKSTQTLNINYAHPFGWKNAPLELQTQLYLLREDSAFFSRMWSVKTIYSLTAQQKTGLVLKSSNSFLQSGRPMVQGAPVATAKFFSYGLFYEINTTNDLYYPRKGWKMSLEFSGGNKTQRIDAINNKPLTQLTTHFQAEKYVLLNKKNVLMLRLDGADIYSKQLYINELYRVGGLRSLRGFNENRFFAARYGVGTLEHRFFFEENSFLFAFYEQGWLQYKAVGGNFDAKPLGVGVGLSFTTKGGVFALSYALGHVSKTETLSFNNAKIHFGYVGRF